METIIPIPNLTDIGHTQQNILIQRKTYQKFLAYIAITGVLMIGVFNLICLRIQDDQGFRHILFQETYDILGCGQNYVTFQVSIFITKFQGGNHFKEMYEKNKEDPQKKKTVFVPMYWAILCVLTSIPCGYFFNSSLFFISPPIFSMLRGTNILFTTIQSRLIFKRRIQKHHAVGGA